MCRVAQKMRPVQWWGFLNTSFLVGAQFGDDEDDESPYIGKAGFKPNRFTRDSFHASHSQTASVTPVGTRRSDRYDAQNKDIEHELHETLRVDLEEKEQAIRDGMEANARGSRATTRYHACRAPTAYRPVYTWNFSCDFDAISRSKCALRYRARKHRVDWKVSTPLSNFCSLGGIWSQRFATTNTCGVGWGRFCAQNRIKIACVKRPNEHALDASTQTTTERKSCVQKRTHVGNTYTDKRALKMKGASKKRARADETCRARRRALLENALKVTVQTRAHTHAIREWSSSNFSCSLRSNIT